ncbi:MAG: MOSC domain-containing protein [Cyanobacteria bacterium QH_1_48_107]|nr:MAG: MOSC domain-containing protein [Cyanobacteria bacterium QH_1_48_107]
MPYIARILIYPIKSLDGVAVNRATVLPGGSLEFDRQFAIFDEKGKFVNGKRNAKVHLLRTSFDLDAQTITLQVQGSEQSEVFNLCEDQIELETWLSHFFDQNVFLRQNKHCGFPDDTDASGPTVISTATLEAVANWFPDISIDSMRSRLRANLEIEDVPAFWEDQLFANPDEVCEFKVGDLRVGGINPCQRCVVPTRDPLTSEAYPQFQKIFMRKRRETLPSWANSSRFNHFFRLSVNTKIPTEEAGKGLEVGDELVMVGNI